jgi:FtsP/CotA-like multicopper oxidase with cupredoxin domain
VAYWLELDNEKCEYSEKCEDKKKQLTILALDGVVPARPADPDKAAKPVDAFTVPDLLLMPASRAELYVRNDDKLHDDEQVFILKTKGLNAGTDWWPEIQLARIVLKPNHVKSPIVAGLNAPIAKRIEVPPAIAFVPKVEPPPGCVRDIDPAMGEHRRITFDSEINSELNTDWTVKTEIVRPPTDKKLPVEEKWFKSVPEKKVGPITFEAYKNKNGTFDWTGEHNLHVCVELKPGGSSHKQLWVLVNNTGSLHNFHIHQMKFRLAKASELCGHGIQPPEESETCPERECLEPNQRLYIDDLKLPGDLGPPKCPDTIPAIEDDEHAKISDREWHDTIPMPTKIGSNRVFLIMSFDDNVQLGRFVFHCHILKHEDKGLMAPIEVWNGNDVSAQ